MALDFSALDDISALIRGQDTGKGIRKVRVDAIQPDPNQPRKAFDEGALAELAASIQSVGIIQPPVVRTQDSGYLLISGERRWRAARQLGWEKIDVIVRDDLNSRAQLVENIQREALSPWEIYRVISAELDAGTTHADLARSIGKSRTWVTAYAAVDGMPEPLVSALREGRVTGITALSHLQRLHAELPEKAAALLDTPDQISRTMIEQARVEAASLNLPENINGAQSVVGGAEQDDDSAMHHPSESIPKTVEEGLPLDRRLTLGKVRAHMPVRIRAYFEDVSWIVDYGCQREIDGRPSVKLEGEGGTFKFAPLETLRLRSIEWL
jgi:ParB/RepB/Spo0J family partition protein